jgi:hypothetical protein
MWRLALLLALLLAFSATGARGSVARYRHLVLDTNCTYPLWHTRSSFRGPYHRVATALRLPDSRTDFPLVFARQDEDYRAYLRLARDGNFFTLELDYDNGPQLMWLCEGLSGRCWDYAHDRSCVAFWSGFGEIRPDDDESPPYQELLLQGD